MIKYSIDVDKRKASFKDFVKKVKEAEKIVKDEKIYSVGREVKEYFIFYTCGYILWTNGLVALVYDNSKVTGSETVMKSILCMIPRGYFRKHKEYSYVEVEDDLKTITIKSSGSVSVVNNVQKYDENFKSFLEDLSVPREFETQVGNSINNKLCTYDVSGKKDIEKRFAVRITDYKVNVHISFQMFQFAITSKVNKFKYSGFTCKKGCNYTINGCEAYSLIFTYEDEGMFGICLPISL